MSATATITLRNQSESAFLLLPAELRLRILEYVIGSCTVYVRMKWTGICTPAGFKYSRLEDRAVLLKHSENKVLAHSIPFEPDIRNLSITCRQIQKDSECLPFEGFTWAFESAFTLDQWISMRDYIPVQLKAKVKTVAMPSPGPSKSSERVLSNMRRVYLIRSVNAADYTPSTNAVEPSGQVMITLDKSKATGNWTRKNV